jgi:hypothetical protein
LLTDEVKVGRFLTFVALFAGVTYMVGPRQLPHLASLAGRATGRAVVLVQQAKLTFESAVTKHNLHDVRADVQRDIDALRSIRNEIRYAPTTVKAAPPQPAQQQQPPPPPPPTAH